VQRLLRVLLRGREVVQGGERDVAGACVFGMKGVGKSCAVGRVIERAKQQAPELQVVVLHGEIEERSVLEAFQEAIAESGGDEVAERLLARANEDAYQRARRVMEHWRRRHVAVILDDFAGLLERECSPLEQEVVMLTLEGSTGPEIAADLHVSDGHVRVLRHRAFAKLRRALGEEAP